MSQPSNDDIADEVRDKLPELRDLVDQGHLNQADDLFGETWKLFRKLKKQHSQQARLRGLLDGLDEDIETLRTKKKAASSSSSSAGERVMAMVCGGVWLES